MKRIEGKISGYTGVLPDFLIIGAQKCGTTSLYDNLTRHPCIYPASKKEVGYFDRFYYRGLAWYRTQFPSFIRKCYSKNVLRRGFITGEASTGYIINPHSLKRISRVIPNAKLILLLRNPVDRAYSHYQHTVRIGTEKLSFEEAIQKEDERIGDEWERMLREEKEYNIDMAHYSYLRTGIYVHQVKRLLKLFNRKQVLILKTEDLNTKPKRSFLRVLDFLNVPVFEPDGFRRSNIGKYSSMSSKTKRWLEDYFKPHNLELYQLLDVDFGWDKERMESGP